MRIDFTSINYIAAVLFVLSFFMDIESFFVRQNFSRTFRVFMLSMPQSSVNVYNICTQCIIVMKYISMMKIGPYYYRLTYYSGIVSDQCCVWFVEFCFYILKRTIVYELVKDKRQNM